MKRKLICIMAIAFTTWIIRAALNPHITDLDLNIDGVADYDEFFEPSPSTTPKGPGGFVCSNGWKMITLKAVGVNDPMKTRLNWNSSKIEVWTATNGGMQVLSPTLWDPASSMPTQLWVKGVSVSATGPTKDASGNWTNCGPETLCLEAINNGANPTTPGTYYDRVAFTVFMVDLDIDSDNDDGVGNPDRNLTEDLLEDGSGTGWLQYGKFIMVNQNDDDADGVPDYADLCITANGTPRSENEGQFVPLKIEIKPDIDWSTATVRINYDGDISLNTALFSGVDIGNGYTNYTGAKTGGIRIWKDCAPSDSRIGTNYVQNGLGYTASSLGFNQAAHEKTFFVEGINSVEKSKITATLSLGTSYPAVDTVTVTVVDANIGVNCNNNMDNTDGMRVGVPDVEFIIDSNDDIIKHQRHGFEFWWGRDTNTITQLGLVDLFPVRIVVPTNLYSWNLDYFLMTTGPLALIAYNAVSPSSDRRAFLKDASVAVSQLPMGGKYIGTNLSSLSWINLLPGTNEFVFRGEMGSSACVTGALNVLVLVSGTGVHVDPVVADSVKLVLKRDQDFYPMMSARGSDSDASWTYRIEPNASGTMLSKVIHRYPFPVKISGPDPDPGKSKYLIHAHGYRVTESDAYAELGETFRRTYWTGYRGNFVGFTWEGNERLVWTSISYGQNVENAFRTGPCFLQLVHNTAQHTWGASPENIDVWMHSLGNQMALDGLRLWQIANPGVKLVHTLSSIEAAIWSETFWPQSAVQYKSPPNDPTDAITYSVEDLKLHSWAFWFNQTGQSPLSAADMLVNSYNYDDYALWLMRFDECSIRNPGIIGPPDRYNRKWLSVWGTEIGTNRAPYEALSSLGRDLSHTIPAMLRLDNRYEYAPGGPTIYIPSDLVPCQGQVTNACATANINANSFGWNQYSHGGFKGGSEAMPVTLPGMPSFTPFETPLFTIWKWFDRMELMKAYPRGVE
jgi:hypothetical protein